MTLTSDKIIENMVRASPQVLPKLIQEKMTAELTTEAQGFKICVGREGWL